MMEAKRNIRKENSSEFSFILKEFYEKLYTFISILIISFSCFIYILYKPKDYVVNYKIDNYNVKEIYVKSLEKYKVFINYNDRVYPLIIDSEFKRNRKIINNIDVYENEKDSCLIINLIIMFVIKIIY